MHFNNGICTFQPLVGRVSIKKMFFLSLCLLQLMRKERTTFFKFSLSETGFLKRARTHASCMQQKGKEKNANISSPSPCPIFEKMTNLILKYASACGGLHVEISSFFCGCCPFRWELKYYILLPFKMRAAKYSATASVLFLFFPRQKIPRTVYGFRK